MTNNTETYTTVGGNEIVVKRNQDGRIHRPTQAAILRDLSVRIDAQQAIESEEAAKWQTGEAYDSERWEAAIDARTALMAEYYEVQVNGRAVVVGSTEWLASQNID
jgi:hypothetical protein